MFTKILSSSTDDMSQAVSIIRSGGLVAFPTETVYGLGADGLDPIAVAKIFEAKGRPQDNPLILHVARIADFEVYAENIRPYVYVLLEEFSPGPITFVLEKRDIVPSIVTAGLDTVCLRIPNNRIALDLIELSEVPIAGPSANRSGRPSPTSASHVYDDLDGRIDAIIDGGSTDIGIESTVLDCTGETPAILREGAVTREMIESILGIPISGGGEGKKSPGTRYRHYAPNIPLVLSEKSDRENLTERIRRGENIGLIYYDNGDNGDSHDSIFHFSELSLLSRALFSLFRESEKKQHDTLYIERVPLHGIGRALMNRIEKAVTGN